MDNSNTNQEIWKDIVGYEGMYQVSNQGRVKSLKRKRVIKDRILKPSSNTKGYPSVNLNRNGKASLVTVHKLVTQAFLGNRPNDYQVNHKDGNKQNNHIDNLEYCTNLENRIHAEQLGLMNQPKGTNHYNARLNSSHVLEIRRLAKETNLTYRQIGEQFGIAKSTVTGIVNRRKWKHI